MKQAKSTMEDKMNDEVAEMDGKISEIERG
jgi:hypothetical protein